MKKRVGSSVALMGAFVAMWSCASWPTFGGVQLSAQTPAAQVPLDPKLAEAYVRAQEALAADNFAAAKKAFAEVATIVDEGLKPLARAVADARDIRTLRVALKPLSEQLASRALPPGYVTAFCPMFDSNRGAKWIQKDGEVANPYYGAAMLRCGTIDNSPATHMDHNPRFEGGIFFMAPDQFHHVEGTYPSAGVVRVRVYDNFTNEVDVTKFKGARIVTKEEFDEASKTYKEVSAFPLVAKDGGKYLEAAIPAPSDPSVAVEATAKITLLDGGNEERFDFIFAGPAPEVPKVMTVITLPEGGPTIAGPPSPLFADRQPLPTTPAGIAEQIGLREKRINEFMQAGQYGQLFIPALEAKELALRLEAHIATLPPAERPSLNGAVKDIIRGAWLLDMYGDLGNRLKVQESFKIMEPGIAVLTQRFSPKK